MSHLPLLTIINFLPSVGALLILCTFGDKETVARNARAIAMLFTPIFRPLSPEWTKSISFGSF